MTQRNFINRIRSLHFDSRKQVMSTEACYQNACPAVNDNRWKTTVVHNEIRNVEIARLSK